VCGIAGYIEFGNDLISKGRPYELLNDMMNTIDHRGPDDYGMTFYGYALNNDKIDPKKVKSSDELRFKIALGHKRLSIIDLSENGRQPMSNSTNDLEIIFNGEIYNYIELRDDLSDKKFITESDTEVLIASFEKWGVEMLNKLDGMFSFALLDKKRNKLICARDPVGIKPFYFNFSNKGFVFGSEPRTVLKGLGIKGSMDDAIASEFLLMGITDHSDRTFYNEVKQLPGGHWMEIDLSGGTNGPIQYRSSSESIMSSDKDYTKETYDNLVTSISRQLRADVKLGTSLSGGIDSGTIVTLAGDLLKENSDNYNTLTFSFPGFQDNESKFAKSIAEHSGMKWNTVTPSGETIVNDLDNMIISMGEPFSTLSMFAQYKVMESAAGMGIKVMLDGQGGDEIYLGYPRVAQRALLEYLKSFRIPSFFKEWFGLKKHASIPLSRSLLGNIFFSSALVAINRNKQRMKPFINGDILSSYRPDIAEDVYSRKNIFLLQQDELTKYCLPRLLRYADRNSMAFSVESRVPHLSKVMLDFALKLPLNWRVRNGWTKYSVRKALSGKLPDEILWSNKKQGFPVPQKYWVDVLRNNIELWLKDNKDVSDIVNTKAIISAIDNGKGDMPYLWRAISLGLWRAKCFE
jgi:asparagine synthase (glutamine-hydrolysing)